ncbi:MAG: hypothetical protein F6J90_29200 [Moorea sp. SIOASIH]|uniref:hypothetical protein n=1 Tax=Moorena sp. SIOASIH TaxID=2607817 RepID=UPI0013B74B9B|nr:hypothetical protein [Moorena sp. SIOASIH]NEO40203.1 hypothetical protein [Moorena sp. SIOASIH]
MRSGIEEPTQDTFNFCDRIAMGLWEQVKKQFSKSKLLPLFALLDNIRTKIWHAT